MANTWFHEVEKKDDAINIKRRSLQAVGNTCLKAPDWNKVAYVLPLDGFERAETLISVVAAVHQPVVWICLGPEQPSRPTAMRGTRKSFGGWMASFASIRQMLNERPEPRLVAGGR